MCEESNIMHHSFSGAPTNSLFKWSISGPKQTYFTLDGQTGSSYIYGENLNSLWITDFPQYPFYPQYITLTACVYDVAGNKYCDKIRIKIIDCDNDDPTCSEYYNGFNGLSKDESDSELEVKDDGIVSVGLLQYDEYDYVLMYDIMGRILFKGNQVEFKSIDIDYSGIVLLQYLKNNRIIKVAKEVIVH